MGVTVDHEIRSMTIEHQPHLAIAQHPVFGEWFPSKRACRRREMREHDAHIGVESPERLFQTMTFALGSDGQPFQSTRMNGIRTFDWPETATGTSRASNPDARSIRKFNGRGFTVEHEDAAPLQDASERRAP
jgi:hypothetical protein